MASFTACPAGRGRWSRTFSTSELPEITDTLSLDVYVPSPQPNPYWTGDIQAFLSCPSAGLDNAPLGGESLTNLFPNEFNALAFPLTSAMVGALSASHEDCSWRLDLNVNQGAGQFNFDRLGFLD